MDSTKQFKQFVMPEKPVCGFCEAIYDLTLKDGSKVYWKNEHGIVQENLLGGFKNF